MCWSARGRACALMLAVALLMASLPARPRSGCTQCAPDCPMHAKKLGCHHGTGSTRCHEGSGNVLRGGCGRYTPGMPGATLHATLVPRVVTVPVVVRHGFSPAEVLPVVAPALEPPSEPPEVLPV